MKKILKNFRLNEKEIKSMEEMREFYMLSSETEVVRRALKIMKIIHDAEKEGSSFIIRNKDKKDTGIIFI